jgi:hypothetical protein
MSGRIIYYYERTLTAQVADIEHIESQSLNSYGVIKIFFHKDVNIAECSARPMQSLIVSHSHNSLASRSHV